MQPPCRPGPVPGSGSLPCLSLHAGLLRRAASCRHPGPQATSTVASRLQLPPRRPRSARPRATTGLPPEAAPPPSGSADPASCIDPVSGRMDLAVHHVSDAKARKREKEDRGRKKRRGREQELALQPPSSLLAGLPASSFGGDRGREGGRSGRWRGGEGATRVARVRRRRGGKGFCSAVCGPQILTLYPFGISSLPYYRSDCNNPSGDAWIVTLPDFLMIR